MDFTDGDDKILVTASVSFFTVRNVGNNTELRSGDDLMAVVLDSTELSGSLQQDGLTFF